jgi:hypothetical protein
MLPLAPQTIRLISMRRIVEFPSPEGLFVLIRFFFPIRLVTGCFLAWMLAFAPKTFDMEERDHLTLGFLLMVPALAISGASELWHLNLLVPRYLLCSAPGAILAWGSCLRALGPPWVRQVTLAGGLLFSAALAGGLTFVPDFHREDWRSAVRNAPSDRMLAYTGIAETRQLDWLTDPKHWDYLIAPVSVYQPEVTQANTSLVPFEFTPADLEYMEHLLTGFTSEKSVNVIVRADTGIPLWAFGTASVSAVATIARSRDRTRAADARIGCVPHAAAVAQLVVAPDCGSGCRGFKSHQPPQPKFVQSGDMGNSSFLRHR